MVLHKAAICFALLAVIFAAPVEAKRSGPQPIGSFELEFLRDPAEFWVHARLTPADPGTQSFTVDIYEIVRNPSGLPIPRQLTVYTNNQNEDALWRREFSGREGLFRLHCTAGWKGRPDVYWLYGIISSETLAARARFDRDGCALNTLEQLLAAARRVGKQPTESQSASYRLLPESDAAKMYGNGMLIVPLDEYFRTKMLAWSQSENPLARLSAAQALANFIPPQVTSTDPEAIAALRKLAVDSYAETYNIHPWATEQFCIRQIAIRTLDYRAPNAPRDPSEFKSIPLTGPTSIYCDLSIWRSTALTLFILVCALGGMHVWRRPRRLVSPAAVIWALVATAILLIGYYSHSVTRELVWTTKDTCHSIASRDGNIEYQQLYFWNKPARDELLYARFDSPELPDFLWKPLKGWQSSFAGFGIGKGGIDQPYDLSTALPRHPALRLSAPWWSLSIPFWLIALGITISRIRARRRTRKGHCAHCGYDLRASPTRCPECGASAIPA